MSTTLSWGQISVFLRCQDFPPAVDRVYQKSTDLRRSRTQNASNSASAIMVDCPICSKTVKEANINSHLDSGCISFNDEPSTTESPQHGPPQVASFFRTPSSKKIAAAAPASKIVKQENSSGMNKLITNHKTSPLPTPQSNKRPAPTASPALEDESLPSQFSTIHADQPLSKRFKPNILQRAAPLAKRMRPRTLNEVYGQDLVDPTGVLSDLIESDRVPSMIL